MITFPKSRWFSVETRFRASGDYQKKPCGKSKTTFLQTESGKKEKFR